MTRKNSRRYERWKRLGRTTLPISLRHERGGVGKPINSRRGKWKLTFALYTGIHVNRHVNRIHYLCRTVPRPQ